MTRWRHLRIGEEVGKSNRLCQIERTEKHPGALLIAGCLREHEVTAVWQERRPGLAEDSPIRRVDVARRLFAGVQPAKARAPKQE